MEANFSKTALFEFLDLLGEKGLLNANTAQSYRVACGKILVDLTTAEEEDVRKVDIALAIRKFNNKNPGALAPASLGEYQRRVSTSITEFRSYIENPVGYKGRSRATSKSEPGEKPQTKRKPSGATEPQAMPAASMPQTPPATTGLSYSFPLRQDFIAQLVLPKDLTTDEANRLMAFVQATAIDFRAR